MVPRMYFWKSPANLSSASAISPISSLRLRLSLLERWPWWISLMFSFALKRFCNAPRQEKGDQAGL